MDNMCKAEKKFNFKQHPTFKTTSRKMKEKGLVNNSKVFYGMKSRVVPISGEELITRNVLGILG